MRDSIHIAWRHNVRRAVSLVLAVTLIIPASALATPVSADTSGTGEAQAVSPGVDAETLRFRQELAAKQARLAELKDQLDELDRELAIAAEAYNAAVEELDSTQQRVSATQIDLANAESAYDTQSALLQKRAVDIYRDGELSTLDVVLGSKSVTDFLARLKFLNALGQTDAEIAAELRAQRDQVRSTAADLAIAEQKAEELEFIARARQIEVILKIQERQEVLASTEAELLEMLEDEAERRQLEEAALMREILSGADKAGIQVTPGSPVETALAYHGIPYLWGGATPAGFDCSGLVMYVFKQHGVDLPHYSRAQFAMGEKVAPAALQPGDVVFFGSPVYHVGIYVGAGYFIHAPRTGDFVKLSRLAERDDYAGARRYSWQYRTGPIQGVSSNPTDALR
ncbi:MAG: NlpC/P60 family protein [Actinomycetia bacterium]|nr:NlpC/P60 family protein [Actinomycetes bacterium]